MALIETFSETFPGTSLDTGVWTASAYGGPDVADGRATWSRAAGAGHYESYIRTVTSYTLAGSSVRVQLQVLTGAASAAAPRVFFYDPANLVDIVGLYLNYPLGQFHFHWYDAAGASRSTQVAVPTGTEWVRLRDGGSGVIHLDTSPDGATWTSTANTGTAIYQYTNNFKLGLGARLPSSPDASSVAFYQVNGPSTVTAAATGSWGLGGPATSTAAANWNVVVPPVWAAETADVLVGASAGTFTVEPGFWPAAATGRVTVIAGAGTFELGEGPPVWLGETGTVTVEANAGMFFAGTLVYGDNFYAPVLLSGLSGVASANLAVATLQTDEPYTHGMTRSWWFRYNAAGPGVLTISSLDATPHWVDVYQTTDSPNIADVQLIGSAERALGAVDLSVAVSVGTYYVRVISSAADADISIAYTATVNDVELVAEISGSATIEQAPGSVTIGVLNAAPGETVRFEFNPPPSEWQPIEVPRPIELAEIAADESGVISGAVIDLPLVQAGSHAITVRGLASGRIDTVAVTVTLDPTPDDDETETPAEPDFVVGYWVLHDYTPGGLGTFTFPINPSSMSSPHAPRNITTEHTVAADGQPILWEGGLTAHQWQFAGYLDSQAHYDALVAFYNVNRRFRLQDHRGRRWIVAFTGLDIKPRRNMDKPWAHEYTVQAHIYGQVI